MFGMRISADRNSKRLEREVASGAVTLRSTPNEIYFDSESRCFLRCIMCRGTAERNRGWVQPTANEISGKSLERFRKLGRVMAAARHIRLTGSGETLLCPDLSRMLTTARRKRVYTSLATNGLLIDDDMAVMLIRSGLGELVVSVDAAGKETYERIRRGARWETLRTALDTFNRAKRASGSQFPRLVFSGNFSRYNIEDLPGFIDVAAAYGAAGVYVFKTMFFDAGLKDHDLTHFPELTYHNYLEARKRASRHGLTFCNWLVHDRELDECRRIETAEAGAPDRTDQPLDSAEVLQRCEFPWTGLRVEMNGSVRACCAESILLGNIDEQPFEEIWNGPPARTMRRLFLEGRPPEGCQNCSRMTKSNDLATTDAVPTGSELRGFLDSPGEGDVLSGIANVRGWVLDPFDISGVSVFVDGRNSGDAVWGLGRPDVIAAHPGIPPGHKPGFMFSLDTGSFTNGYHLLHVRATDTRGREQDRFHTTMRTINSGS